MVEIYLLLSYHRGGYSPMLRFINAYFSRQTLRFIYWGVGEQVHIGGDLSEILGIFGLQNYLTAI